MVPLNSANQLNVGVLCIYTVSERLIQPAQTFSKHDHKPAHHRASNKQSQQRLSVGRESAKSGLHDLKTSDSCDETEA